MSNPISRHISKICHVFRIFDFALFLCKKAVSHFKNRYAHFKIPVLHFKNQRWEFIHENKKVKKKENPLSTKKAAKKKEKKKENTLSNKKERF